MATSLAASGVITNRRKLGVRAPLAVLATEMGALCRRDAGIVNTNWDSF